MKKWLSYWFMLIVAAICVVWEVWIGFQVWGTPIRSPGSRGQLFLFLSLRVPLFAVITYVIWILWLDGVKVLDDWSRKRKGLRIHGKTT